MTSPEPEQVGTRSYILRSGRTTASQRRALAEHWTRFGVDRQGRRLDLDALFGRRAPRVLEIGFGAGHALLAAAAANADRDYLGVEVYLAGLGRVLRALAREGIGNVRVLREDASELVADGLPPAGLDEIWIYFPDPWPKKRHHKRRLVQPRFALAAAGALAPGGVLRAATDWPDYAEQMLAVLEGCPELRNLAGPGQWSPRPPERPLTRFEGRGIDAGREVRDLAFVRR